MRTHAEVVQGIAGFVEANLGLLKSVTESWQPSDVLPDLTADGWPDQIRALRAVEITTQHLIRNGFDPRTGNDPYLGLIYTSFQERATKISHGNTARLANQCGDETLGKICAMVTGDESRHEEAYKRFVGKIVEEDPAEAVLAFARMMKTTVAMPARLMEDGETPDLYDRFAAVPAIGRPRRPPAVGARRAVVSLAVPPVRVRSC